MLDRAAAKIEDKFKDQPLVAAELHHTVGKTYRRLGENVLGEKHLRRAVELRRVHLGEEHPDTLKSMHFLAFYESDLEYSERVLAARRRVLGENHRDTLQSRINLALLVREKGDNVRAITLFRETLAAQQRVMGKDHLETAWTKTCLAHTLSMAFPAGASSEAEDAEIEQLFRHSLTVHRNLAGDGSWFTWSTTMELGRFLSSRGRYKEAEVVYKDGYSRLQAKPAVPPEWRAGLARDLAGLYQRLGNWPACEQMNRESFAGFRKQHGDDHEVTASAAFALAFVLMQNPGQEDEAEQLYRIALPVRRRVLGEGHQDTADTAFRLAESLGAQQKFDEAQSVLREAYTSLAANRASQGAREYEPVLLGWIIDKYRAWGQLERAAEWERIRSAMKSAKKELEIQSK